MYFIGSGTFLWAHLLSLFGWLLVVGRSVGPKRAGSYTSMLQLELFLLLINNCEWLLPISTLINNCEWLLPMSTMKTPPRLARSSWALAVELFGLKKDNIKQVLVLSAQSTLNIVLWWPIANYWRRLALYLDAKHLYHWPLSSFISISHHHPWI